MAGKLFTMEEMLEGMPSFLLAFKESCERHGLIDPTFLKSRTWDDWMRELEAYEKICELDVVEED